MKIISKRRAMHIYRQHAESGLSAFCTGHYQWHGSVCHYYGREVQDISGVLAVLLNVVRTGQARTLFFAA